MHRWIIVLLTLSLAAMARPEEKEMTVKVFVSPAEIPALAEQVLEFYDVTPEYFTCGMSESSYRGLLAKGYRLEVLVPDVRARAAELNAFFHTYQQIMDTWPIICRSYPHICRLDTIGVSAGGRRLIAMKISDNPNSLEPEPRVFFDATIHGNENNGTEILHHALLQLVTRYGTDPDITRWVNTREIWLIPFVNPDGLVSRSRTNARGVDLNRNYGYSWNGGGPSVFSETEVQALYFLGRDNPMVAWTQFHTGTTKAMWPWGYTTFATRDSVTYKYEMDRYGQICYYQSGQISRVLYSVNGGSTDWYYGALGAMGYAVEVCNGQPSPIGEIDTINRKNWTAMKEMIERAGWGVRGMVRDSQTGGPIEALVSVTPPDWFVYSDTLGFFAKYLHPGTYTVTVTANGYQPKTVSGVVVPRDSFAFLEVYLTRSASEPVCAFQCLTNMLSNTNPTSHWWALRKRDGRRFSLDRGGWASFDMGRRTPIVNIPGPDFTVVEDDTDPESCLVYASNNWNGPWTLVGSGTGTKSYDLEAARLQTARFVRIVDDNVGTGGFDIDAIEVLAVNVPEAVYVDNTVIDSPPRGNGDGKLDPGESAELVVKLRNAGRAELQGLFGILKTADAFVVITDSLGWFGDVKPDSIGSNRLDRFGVFATPGTPRGHESNFTLYLYATGYTDSLKFSLSVGSLRRIDPIPDGPREPALYWAYDDLDTIFPVCPQYSWVEIKGVGTRISFANNDAVVPVALPAGFGPFKYYGQRYTQISVSADGWIVPGTYTTSHFSNTGLPSPQAPPGAICLNWDDLYPGYGGSGHVYYYYDEPNKRFIVEYDSVAYYDQVSVRDKFQVIIYDTTLASGSGNNVIVAQYMTANGFTASTVGIQDQTRTIGIQCLLDNSYNNGCWPLGPRRAIKYTTDGPVGLAELEQGHTVSCPELLVHSNPFVERAQFSYGLAQAENVELAVYDGAGRRVRTLFAGRSEAGRHNLAWDGNDEYGRRLAPGVYWVRFVAEGRVVAQKAVKTR